MIRFCFILELFLGFDAQTIFTHYEWAIIQLSRTQTEIFLNKKKEKFEFGSKLFIISQKIIHTCITEK